MPQLFAQIGSRSAIWVWFGPINAAVVYSLTPVPILWDTGAPDTLPRHTPCPVLPTLALTVDLTSGPWLVCTAQGLGKAYLAPMAQQFALDTLFAPLVANPQTLILSSIARIAPRDWQQ